MHYNTEEIFLHDFLKRSEPDVSEFLEIRTLEDLKNVIFSISTNYNEELLLIEVNVNQCEKCIILNINYNNVNIHIAL